MSSPHNLTMRPPRPASLYEIAGVWVREELAKFVVVYVAVLLALVFTSIPGYLVVLIGTLFTAVRLYLAGGWYYEDFRIDGQTVIVTGGNAGIGIEIARDLYRRGARVVLACRNLEKAESAAYDIINSTNSAGGGSVVVQHIDMSSFASVRKFVSNFLSTEKRLDVLINNAGIMWVSKSMTGDGNESTLQVNHLSPFLLTSLLLDKLKEAPQGRIINLSSVGNNFASGIDFNNLNGERKWSSSHQYSITKLMNILHTAELSRRLADTNITANSNHPGCVYTGLIDHVATSGPLLLLKKLYLWPTHKTPAQGAQTSVMLAVDPVYSKVSGKYLADCMEVKPNRLADDPLLAEKLWAVSEQMCGLVPDKKAL